MDMISAGSNRWYKMRKRIRLELMSLPFVNNLWVTLVLLTTLFSLLLVVKIIFPITPRNLKKKKNKTNSFIFPPYLIFSTPI